MSKRFRLKKLLLDEVSLVSAGDDPMAEVVIAKSDKTQESDDGDRTLTDRATNESDIEEHIVADADENTPDLPQEIIDYISQLEATVEEQSSAIEELSSTDDLEAELADLVTEDAVLAKADPEVRSLIEKAEERAAQAEAVAKAERDLRVQREFIEKARAFPMISTSTERLGEILKAVNDELDEADAAELTQLLTAANDAIAKGNLFEEVGTSTPMGVDSSVESIASEIRKADPSLTTEQAVARAYETNPSLYTQES